MSKELEKMNIISIVQKLKEDDVIILQKYIENLEKENEKYKEVINKLSKSIDGNYDGFTTINEFGACNDIIELLLEFKDILKEVE